MQSITEQESLHSPGDCFKKGSGRGEGSLGSGSGSGSSWLPLNVVTFVNVVNEPRRGSFLPSLLLCRAARALRACCPTPSWRAWPVFVIVVLALGQAWLGASLVGTVCTVSAEPSLSSYTINFFFSSGRGGVKEEARRSFSDA